jgi:hypothetical protein
MMIGNPSIPVAQVAAASVAIAAGAAGPTVIKGSPGTYYGLLITSLGVGIPTIFDNASAASGKIIGMTIASAPLGPVPAPMQGVSCANGITVLGGATMPAMTIFFS